MSWKLACSHWGSWWKWPRQVDRWLQWCQPCQHLAGKYHPYFKTLLYCSRPLKEFVGHPDQQANELMSWWCVHLPSFIHLSFILTPSSEKRQMSSASLSLRFGIILQRGSWHSSHLRSRYCVRIPEDILTYDVLMPHVCGISRPPCSDLVKFTKRKWTGLIRWRLAVDKLWIHLW